MSTVTNLLEDGADVAAHMAVPNTAVDNVLSALVVHVEEIAKKVGYAVEGELPKLEKQLLGYAAPEPTADQKKIEELQAKVDALSSPAAGAAGAADPSAEDAKLTELEAQAAKRTAEAKEKRIAELEAQLAEAEAPAADAAPAAAAAATDEAKTVE